MLIITNSFFFKPWQTRTMSLSFLLSRQYLTLLKITLVSYNKCRAFSHSAMYDSVKDDEIIIGLAQKFI